MNVIGALVEQGTLSLFDANINADISSQWLKQNLIPKASVIVMDNATFHKRKDIEDTVRGTDHIPVYSPDLNPIEHK